MLYIRRQCRPTLPWLEHYNDRDDMNVALAVHAHAVRWDYHDGPNRHHNLERDGKEIATSVPLLRHTDSDEMKKAIKTSDVEENKQRFKTSNDASDRTADVFPSASIDEDPLYDFTSNAVKNDMLDKVMLIGDGVVTEAEFARPRVSEAAELVPSAMVAQVLDGNINGRNGKTWG